MPEEECCQRKAGLSAVGVQRERQVSTFIREQPHHEGELVLVFALVVIFVSNSYREFL
jgi:hypothetical protein